MCSKLTQTHVNPTCFLKMSVKFAVQVMSRSIVNGLKLYREEEMRTKEEWEPMILKNSEPMEKLFKLLDECFDIMNARHPKHGINQLNWAGYKKVTSRIYLLFRIRINS